MSYIHDPELVDMLGGRGVWSRARDDKGKWLLTPHRQTGLWCNVEVPRTGWTCTRVRWNTVVLPSGELMDAECTCEMCEVARIKWVHTMRHPEYPDPIDVGKVCAGIMQQNMEAAAQHERYAKAVERARKRHAGGLIMVKAAMAGALQSDWDEQSWIEDDDWPAERTKGRRVWSNGDWVRDGSEWKYIEPGWRRDKSKTATSFMVLEGIGEYWMSVNRWGLDGFGAAVGKMSRGERGYGGRRSKRRFRTLAEAKTMCTREMAKQWRAKLDKGLADVLDRNRAVNDWGDVIDLG